MKLSFAKIFLAVGNFTVLWVFLFCFPEIKDNLNYGLLGYTGPEKGSWRGMGYRQLFIQLKKTQHQGFQISVSKSFGLFILVSLTLNFKFSFCFMISYPFMCTLCGHVLVGEPMSNQPRFVLSHQTSKQIWKLVSDDFFSSSSNALVSFLCVCLHVFHEVSVP